MNMEPVRFGVIGCGLMGREFASVSMRWLHLACELPRPVIVAACDLSPKNLDWFRQVPDTKYFYSDYHELLANPEVEAVYCAVPHHLHAQVYGDVIRAGKHLIGETPFGMALAACEEVEAAMAGRPEVFVRGASEFPFYPAVQQMVKWYREGAFGLGAGKWRVIRTVVLPGCTDGVITGCILAVGRILGESAALLFTAGLAHTLHGFFSGLGSSGATLTVALYVFAKERGEFEVAFAIAAILMLLTLIINLSADLVARYFRRKKEL